MSKRSLIPEVINGEIIITNKTDYDEVRLSVDDMESVMNNCYAKGRADAIDEIINNIRQMQTIKRPVEEMLGICKVGEMVEELMEKNDE